MEEKNARFDGSIPENYDHYLGSVLFEPYAVDLAGRLDPETTANVLELACGTGILTRQLRRRLSASSRLVATDLNDPMLQYARAKSDQNEGIEWKQADASALPFPDGSFDLVVCQFGLMFVPDKFAALREMHRVLRNQTVSDEPADFLPAPIQLARPTRTQGDGFHGRLPRYQLVDRVQGWRESVFERCGTRSGLREPVDYCDSGAGRYRCGHGSR